jgi:hypothetical protein
VLEKFSTRHPAIFALLQACKALRSCAQHGIQQLAQQVLHKLQQSTPPDTTLPRLPPTDAAVAAAAAEAIKAAAAANENAPDNAQADAIDVILNDYLGTVVPALEPQTSWQYWEDFLEALAAGNCSSITDLQQKAQWLGIFPASDLSQDQLEDAVWAAFGLATATSKVPAVLLVACRRERHSEAIHADGPDGCAALHAALKRLAELAREMRLPLGLQAQRWGYGERGLGLSQGQTLNHSCWWVGYKVLGLALLNW